MKKLICLAMLFFTSSAFSRQLHNFDEIKTAVADGKLIRIYIDYTACSSSSKLATLPNIAAVYTPNAMAINSEGDIGTYVLYFTMKDPRYPSRPVYQYGRYVISRDNSVTLNFSVLNAADFTKLKGDDTLNCKLNTGVNVFDNE